MIKSSGISFFIFCFLFKRTVIPEIHYVFLLGFVLLTIFISLIIRKKYNIKSEWSKVLYISLRNFIIFGLGITSIIVIINYVFKDNKTHIEYALCDNRKIFYPNSEYVKSYRIYLYKSYTAYLEVDEITYSKVEIGDQIKLFYEIGFFNYKVIDDFFIK